MTSCAFTWVSPYSPDDARGGWKAMQFHMLRALEQRLGPATRIAPVEVAEEFVGKWTSRFQKQLHIPRRYAYYSESRLASFARVVKSKLPSSGSQPVIFFGALPFVKCRPSQPFYIYTDGAFFIHYWEYNQDRSHSKKDIERICATEAEFMRRAAGVWCSSQWVVDRIIAEYHVPAQSVRCVGTGPGDVPPPIEPIRYENFLVTVAADFERKGGRFAADVVGALRGAGLDWRIKFIGAKPPEDVLSRDYVDWCGWLDLNKPDDRNRFAGIMSACVAQILPSRRDLTPLAIPEASLYRKATFASDVGGIPEMIGDGITGFLFSTDETVAHVAGRLALVLRKQSELKKMGEAAYQWQQTKWNWTEVAKKIAVEIQAKKEVDQPTI